MPGGMMGSDGPSFPPLVQPKQTVLEPVVITCKHIDVTIMLSLADACLFGESPTQSLNRGGFGPGGGRNNTRIVDGNKVSIVPLSRSNSIVIMGASPESVAAFRKLLKEVDVEANAPPKG